MVNKAHKILTGTDLHECKDTNTAAANTVRVANGAGGATWQKITASQLTGTGNPFGAQLLHVHDQKVASHAGTATAGSWQTRTLNTVITNEIVGASLSSNQIILPAGTYHVEARAPGYRVRIHQLRLYNVTDSVELVTGTTQFAENGSGAGSGSVSNDVSLKQRFILAGTKTIELQQRFENTQLDNGLGVANTWGLSIFAQVWIWKVG